MENDPKIKELSEILDRRFGGVQSYMARAVNLSLPRLNRILRGKTPLSDKAFNEIKGAIDRTNAETVLNSENDDVAAKDQLYECRRLRLKEIVEERFQGVVLRFAHAIEMAPPSASYIIKGRRNIGEKLARRLERLLSLPPGDLDGIREIADIDEADRYKLRRERFQQALDQVFGGSLAACARHLGVAEAYAHQMIHGQKTIGQMIARSFEKRLLLEPGAIDRLEEITFPVRSIVQNGKGIEIKLALLLSLVQERSMDALTVSMLHGVVDVALERLRASES